MTTEGEERAVRLASIVAVDVAGFSTMSERDQLRTAGKIEALRKRIEAVATRTGGRVFNTAGDGFMLEFGSAGAAVEAISELLNRRPRGEPSIRIGAHVGDVVVAVNNDLLGHGVNVAARLQSLAAPNTALVSGEFRSMARTSPSAAFKSKGRQPLENINQKVATFAIISKRQKVLRALSWGAWATAAAGAIAAGVIYWPTITAMPEVKKLVADAQQTISNLTRPAAATPATVEQQPAQITLDAALPAERAAELSLPPPTSAAATPAPAAAAPETRIQPGQTLRDCEACPELIVIPEGSFTMGSPESEPDRFATEGPQHAVSVPMFAMGKYEITFAEWDACLAGGGCKGFSPNDRGWGRGRRPVIGVSWQEAQAFVDWLNLKAGKAVYRLPTEAEWEYAARAGAQTRYAFGDRLARAQANFGSGRSDPVGSYQPNAFGLFDMHGNAWEWVADCYRPNYTGAPADGSAVEDSSCKLRPYRGGGFDDPAAAQRAANRRRADADTHISGVGFRVVRQVN
jgi:formylglycine-generating enzyme required for sulfatase activity/class 3 adenylate cyclase